MSARRDRVIVRAYVDTGAIDRHCPACGAKPAEWCQTPDGRDRRIPCVPRYPSLGSSAPDPPAQGPTTRTFSEPVHHLDDDLEAPR